MRKPPRAQGLSGDTCSSVGVAFAQSGSRAWGRVVLLVSVLSTTGFEYGGWGIVGMPLGLLEDRIWTEWRCGVSACARLWAANSAANLRFVEAVRRS